MTNTTVVAPDEIRRRIRENLTRLQLAHRVYDQERDAIEKVCPHDWGYEPDPSGNNDSGWTCSICGRFQRVVRNAGVAK